MRIILKNIDCLEFKKPLEVSVIRNPPDSCFWPAWECRADNLGLYAEGNTLPHALKNFRNEFIESASTYLLIDSFDKDDGREQKLAQVYQEYLNKEEFSC